MPLVIGGDNLPSPVGIRLTDLLNIAGASGPPGPPPRFRHHCSAVALLAPLALRFRHHWICMMYLIVILAVGVLLLLQPETEVKVQLGKIRPQSMLTKLC